MDIHGQNEHQTLFHPDAQLNFLDAFAGTRALADEVRSTFAVWQRKVQQVDDFKQNEQERLRSIDLLTFQAREIEEAQLKSADEDEVLRRERAILSHAEKLSQLSGHAYGVIYEDENSAGV